jgi:hypothetical protein
MGHRNCPDAFEERRTSCSFRELNADSSIDQLLVEVPVPTIISASVICIRIWIPNWCGYFAHSIPSAWPAYLMSHVFWLFLQYTLTRLEPVRFVFMFDSRLCLGDVIVSSKRFFKQYGVALCICCFLYTCYIACLSQTRCLNRPSSKHLQKSAGCEAVSFCNFLNQRGCDFI